MVSGIHITLFAIYPVIGVPDLGKRDLVGVHLGALISLSCTYVNGGRVECAYLLPDGTHDVLVEDSYLPYKATQRVAIELLREAHEDILRLTN